MKNFWSFKKEYKILNKVILKSIDKSLNSENIFFGNQLEKFEKEFNKLNKSKFGLAVGSGTEALYIALKCFNIGYGDEVITVSNSAIPTVSAINSVGAKATFVDIKSDYLIDPEKIKKKINKKTKAIISIFAGRAGDAGKDPIPEFQKSIKISKKFKNVEILWASVREPYNYIQAKQLNCHIITIPPSIIEKIEKFGKSFEKLTTETVKAFLVDSRRSKFKI